MRQLKRFVMLAIIGAILGSAIPFRAIGAPPAPCAPPHRLRILDLGMLPDPVRQGQRIQLWSVKLQSDYNGECLTFLEVRDRDQIVGRRVQYLIKPGEGRYTFQAEPGYRFQAQDHCLAVLVNVGNTWTPVDAARRFCARYRPVPPPGGWSLR